jgi:hypothetical protein
MNKWTDINSLRKPSGLLDSGAIGTTTPAPNGLPTDSRDTGGLTKAQNDFFDNMTPAQKDAWGAKHDNIAGKVATVGAGIVGGLPAGLAVGAATKNGVGGWLAGLFGGSHTEMTAPAGTVTPSTGAISSGVTAVTDPAQAGQTAAQNSAPSAAPEAPSSPSGGAAPNSGWGGSFGQDMGIDSGGHGSGDGSGGDAGPNDGGIGPQ